MLNLRRLIGIVILAFLCVIVANAQSQEPAPSTEILGNNKKPQNSENKKHSENDQRGTEQTPLIVKMAPSPNAQEEDPKAKQDKENQAAANRRSEIITIAIAIATFLQAFALIYTIIIMAINQPRYLHHQWTYQCVGPRYQTNYCGNTDSLWLVFCRTYLCKRCSRKHKLRQLAGKPATFLYLHQ